MPSQKRQSFRNSVNIFTSFKPFSFGADRNSGTSKKSTSEEKPGLENLPGRILLEILNYLPVSDLLSISCTSVRLSSLFYDEEIYLRKLRLMGVEGNSCVAEKTDESETKTELVKKPQFSAREEFIKQYTELIRFYVDFRKTGGRDFLLFNDSRSMANIGSMLQRLIRFSDIQPVRDATKIHMTLEAVYYGFESAMLRQFEEAYDEDNTEEMKNLAQALINLNGGNSCFHVFIHKCPLFYASHLDPKQNFYDSLDQTQPVSTVTFEPLEEFADYLFKGMSKEYSRIQQVFPEECGVFDRLLERVFQDITYFRALMNSFYHCTVLSEDIAKDTSSPAQRKAHLFSLFEPFIDEYVVREASRLESQYDTWIGMWGSKVHLSISVRRGFYSNHSSTIFKRNWLKKTTKTLSSESGNAGTKNHPLDNFSPDMTRLSSQEESAPFQLNDLQLLLSVDLALQMININKEALQRCVCFSGAPADSPVKKVIHDCIERIFTLLLKKLCAGNIEPGFAIATERLGAYKADFDSALDSVAPILEFFELVHIGDLILQMVDVYYKQEVCQFVDPNDFLSEAVNEKRQFERKLDDCVAAGLDKSIEALMQQAEFILRSKQVPTEFLPNDKANPDLKPTQACTETVKCLTTHTKLVVGGIDKQTLDVFLAEIGYRFFGLLGKHIKRFTINEAGGFQLISDLNLYHEWACSSLRGQPEAISYFTALKELGNIYIVSPDHLRELLHDARRYQGVLRIEDVYEFVALRSDYRKIAKKVEIEDCIVM
ncbi:Sec10-domain-containing protein [Basidiobolus meristosporus CBS 931.73]|uniref:Sec10-domain-containing protein n=1 Tax=Basidiobolus meristosporus CBS 931.73 TaxID=1314790 RepID=A0A1Y1YF72_9FUNG|nr:Sec10-domain-containing protein [Basidiobolus meristosporus CBS 931.73]ORX96244.1 Sec10-domain-containing protein [Basidiobolus meristosporus CBS 931.73]|eukprot:ORX66680.1 Sec10-domain-containing protein [Basidiobolus meristosporus CBS 931.73]